MLLQKIGRFLVLFLVGFLPWSVIVSVTGTERFGLELMRFAKEILLAAILVVVGLDMWRKKYHPRFNKIDAVIGIYILVLITISASTGTSLL